MIYLMGRLSLVCRGPRSLGSQKKNHRNQVSFKSSCEYPCVCIPALLLLVGMFWFCPACHGLKCGYDYVPENSKSETQNLQFFSGMKRCTADPCSTPHTGARRQSLRNTQGIHRWNAAPKINQLFSSPPQETSFRWAIQQYPDGHGPGTP